ncbi:MAG TPA: PilT/PilU family type 4a pilus ATPase [Candidatus Dormibacteraeota bacterium]|nr:PilT/PilU family type 4a pilus ATPase [Candidatus Dormibacteraeota bacterium]
MTASAIDFAEMRLRELMRVMLRARASDLHLAPELPPMARVDGRIAALAAPPLSTEDVEGVSEALARRRGPHAERGRERDDFAIEDAEFGTVRVHLYRAGGPRIALRALGGAIPAPAEIGVPRRVLEFAQLHGGLVVVAGATGSGKTTTAAALIDAINAEQPRHIVSIEEPIEFRHRSRSALVTQREIGVDVGDAAEGIRAALREDPDVIFLGELRDGAAVETALTAAETGHLVLTTLHARGADAAAERIVDLAPAERRDHVRRQLAHVLAGVVYQRLVARAEGTGRVAAFEILVATAAVRSLLREGKTHQLRNAMATGRAAGMQTLAAHLEELLLRGAVDDATVRAVLRDAGYAQDG